jgi:hypothetical protein
MGGFSATHGLFIFDLTKAMDFNHSLFYFFGRLMKKTLLSRVSRDYPYPF